MIGYLDAFLSPVRPTACPRRFAADFETFRTASGLSPRVVVAVTAWLALAQIALATGTLLQWRHGAGTAADRKAQAT